MYCISISGIGNEKIFPLEDNVSEAWAENVCSMSKLI